MAELLVNLTVQMMESPSAAVLVVTKDNCMATYLAVLRVDLLV